MGYLRLIPTVYVVLAAFGGLFVVIAAMVRAWLGSRYVWGFWAFYLVAVCISCIYKLSGLQLGVSLTTVGHTVYLATVAFVSVGLPLAFGAILMTTSKRSHLRAAAQSWLAIVAVTPIAVALIAIVDYFNLTITTL